MADEFEDHRDGLSTPVHHAVAVTPDDAADLPTTSRALYVGGAGDVALVTKGGETVTFKAAAEGSFLPVRARRVLATGTTATHLLALW